MGVIRSIDPYNDPYHDYPDPDHLYEPLFPFLADEYEEDHEPPEGTPSCYCEAHPTEHWHVERLQPESHS